MVRAMSSPWMWMVRMSRDSKPFFYTFATVCGIIPGTIGYLVMQATSSTDEQLKTDLRRKARPETQMMGRANQDRLGELLGELQRKDNINDRYAAAMKGKTLTRKPYVRIQPIPEQSNSEADKEQKNEGKK